MRKSNVAEFVKKRETDERIRDQLQRRLHVTDSFVYRLGLEKELEGHQGCVNCLEWNSEGRILASASDDFQVILWDPFKHRKIQNIQTVHHGNIFSVKFLPGTNDSTLVTGAGDFQVHATDITLKETTQVCTCATGRVKRLATAPQTPFLFWSASEDGAVRQYDMRSPHSCSGDVTNVLVYLRTHLGHFAEAKCLAVNPLRPEILAVGANDPYVRLYDRRMIRLTKIYTSESLHNQRARLSVRPSQPLELEDNLPKECVQYFVAGHLPVKQKDLQKKFRSLAATYVTFGSKGTDLLLNLGGEQIYLFDITRKQKPKSFDLPKAALSKEYGSTSNGYSNGYHLGTNGYSVSSSSKKEENKHKLPDHVEAMKLTANMFFEKEEYGPAIRVYNEAILHYPNSPVLYGNRAAAYMKRDWDGDMYAALRDCHTTLELDPNHVKAFFRLARCLNELHWTEKAKQCLEVFKQRFPNHVNSHACRALEKDIFMSSLSSPADGSGEDSDDLETVKDGEGSLVDGKLSRVSSQECVWREAAYDYNSITHIVPDSDDLETVKDGDGSLVDGKLSRVSSQERIWREAAYDYDSVTHIVSDSDDLEMVKDVDGMLSHVSSQERIWREAAYDYDSITHIVPDSDDLETVKDVDGMLSHVSSQEHVWREAAYDYNSVTHIVPDSDDLEMVKDVDGMLSHVSSQEHVWREAAYDYNSVTHIVPDSDDLEMVKDVDGMLSHVSSQERIWREAAYDYDSITHIVPDSDDLEMVKDVDGMLSHVSSQEHVWREAAYDYDSVTHIVPDSDDLEMVKDVDGMLSRVSSQEHVWREAAYDYDSVTHIVPDSDDLEMVKDVDGMLSHVSSQERIWREAAYDYDSITHIVPDSDDLEMVKDVDGMLSRVSSQERVWREAAYDYDSITHIVPDSDDLETVKDGEGSLVDGMLSRVSSQERIWREAAYDYDSITHIVPDSDDLETVKDGEGSLVDGMLSRVSSQEREWREAAYDYDKRFYGHCNTTTDIKEANFFGSEGQYIIAGSDDGSVYFWDRRTTNNVRILRGDSSIVNCLQPHPTYCLLASSGIDPLVRLWSPLPEDQENTHEVRDRDSAASSNQRRMKADPFDVVLMNMGYQRVGGNGDDSADDSSAPTYNCHTS